MGWSDMFAKDWGSMQNAAWKDNQYRNAQAGLGPMHGHYDLMRGVKPGAYEVHNGEDFDAAIRRISCTPEYRMPEPTKDRCDYCNSIAEGNKCQCCGAGR